jgi:hypothetical protein
MFEVERQYWKLVSLRVRHDRRISYAKAEIEISTVDFDRAAEESRSQISRIVLALRDRFKKEASSPNAHASAQEVLSLHNDRVQSDQVAPQLGDQRAGESMSLVSLVCRSDEDSRIRDDLHFPLARPRRYLSAIRPRSRGPLPAPT